MRHCALASLILAACTFDSAGVGGSEGTLAESGTTMPPATTSGIGASESTTTATADDGTTTGSTTSASQGESSSGPPVADESGTSAGESSSTTGERDVTHCNGVLIPDLPDAGGPFSEITIANARFPTSDTNIIHVAPSAVVDLEFEYGVASCECEGCITQGMMGLVGAEWRDCFYNGVPACSAALGTTAMQVQAPAAPGFYRLSFWRTWEYECEYQSGSPDGDNAVAGICVASR